MLITDEMTACYHILAEQYLVRKYSLDRLDERFAECSAGFIPHGEEIPCNELKFISLLSIPKLERLTEEQQAVINEISLGEEPDIDIVAFVEDTFRIALAGDIRPGVYHEYYQDVNNEGLLPGESIVFQFSDKSEGDAQDEKVWEAENKKKEVFASVKAQFEKMISDKCPDDKVYLVRI